MQKIYGLFSCATLFLPCAFPQSTCLNFPAGLVPFSSVSYVTAANDSGDQLVVGVLGSGLNTLNQIPRSSTSNQLFCDAVLQLAPQQFYPNVYVPTAAERGGDFSDFTGLVVDPGTNQAFPGGIIPASRLGAVYAFRIGAVQPDNASRNWSKTGSLPVQLVGQFGTFNTPSVLMPSGKVFLTLGNLIEVYDPSTGLFTSPGSLRSTVEKAAILLNDGRVLAVGTLLVGGIPRTNVAELYDPATGRVTQAGPLIGPHGVAFTLSRLRDGRVLVAGGFFDFANGTTDATAAAEIFDPKTGGFAATGSMTSIRSSHFAITLADGRVLMAGGTVDYTLTAEIFDPSSGKFTRTGSFNISHGNGCVTLLPNNKVLIAGGELSPEAELYDPASGTFSLTGSLSAARYGCAIAVLSSGQVLVAGGVDGGAGPPLNTADLYNPATGSFTPAARLTAARYLPAATTLLDGRVLVTGGIGVSFSLNTAELYTPTVQGLVSSQTGLTFRAAQGAATLPSQTVAVLSPNDAVSFNVSASTYTGGNWLKVTPSAGTSTPATPPVPLTITVDATGLSAQDYYGLITLTPTDSTHAPVSIAIVLTVVPVGAVAAPTVSPTGLVFLERSGTAPKAQTFTISNVTSKPLTFSSTAVQAASFFDFTPKAGSINAGQSQTITVTPANTSLSTGVYRGSIKLSFGDGSTQAVDVLLVASAIAGSSTSFEVPTFRAATTCVPVKLLPVLQSIGSGFNTPVAWPTPVIVQLVDDCGVAVNTGVVTASFTNGDGAIPLIPIGNGIWSNTWTPVRPSTGATVRVDAQAQQPPLRGTVQISVQVALNPKVPVIAVGGVLSSGDYLGSPAQGLLVSIFGNALADGSLGNTSLPVPPQLGSTSVIVSGRLLPVLYVSENQVNALIPYELTANTSQQLILRRGNAASVPVPIQVFENQPAILSTAGTGAGQGHIYRVDTSSAQILADPSSPAHAGDVLVIYAVGLGPVTPVVKSGDPAPYTALDPITGNAALIIDGLPAQVLFAGLTPGYSGLYQLNVVVPDGVALGSQVPVTVSVNGKISPSNIFMAVQ